DVDGEERERKEDPRAARPKARRLWRRRRTAGCGRWCPRILALIRAHATSLQRTSMRATLTQMTLATGLRAAPGAGRDQPLLRGTGRGCLLDAQLRSRSERGAERHLLQEPREDERHGGEAHVLRAGVVLNDEDDDLHDEADADADNEHVHGCDPRRAADVE